MNPKTGSAGRAVSPCAPEVADEADVADPGEVAKIKAKQIQNKEGKYGTTSFEPHRPADEDEQEDEESEETTWIEIEMVDEEDNPVPGERYAVTLPNGRVARGTLDENGFARINGIRPPGNCRIEFPDLDREACEKI